MRIRNAALALAAALTPSVLCARGQTLDQTLDQMLEDDDNSSLTGSQDTGNAFEECHDVGDRSGTINCGSDTFSSSAGTGYSDGRTFSDGRSTSFSGIDAAKKMDRQAKRLERRRAKEEARSTEAHDSDGDQPGHGNVKSNGKFVKLLTQNEDALFNFVANISRLYRMTLGEAAPFVSFVLVGMQSSGKSTIIERFLNAPFNIVQEGTGNRCPLDITLIHDNSLSKPVCELTGKGLDHSKAGTNLTTEQVFAAITEHNRNLSNEDIFSSEPLVLVYRASNVQNMRFIDTPGVISNQSTGNDNREYIKTILEDTMKKPNTKLCVLLEPKEFSTNAVVDFCDDTFGGRGKWVNDAIVLMTKFDEQLDDSRSGSKTNSFFAEYHRNGLYPYLTITPTLDREDLSPEDLLDKRKALLKTTPAYEQKKFKDWKVMQEKYREVDPDDPKLSPEVIMRIGFPAATYEMREVMLADIATRVPEVLISLKKKLSNYGDELEVLHDGGVGHINPDQKLLGGAQFHRAFELMGTTVTEAIPDISNLKQHVASGVGYLQGGLKRENWERATLSLVKLTSKSTFHPGINFFIKHAGGIFRNLFPAAIKDVKQQSIDAKRLFDSFPIIENHLTDRFDGMLWELMQNAANRCHVSIEPWYQSVNPGLPNFHPDIDPSESSSDQADQQAQGIFRRLLSSLFQSSVDDREAKELLHELKRERAKEKKRFLAEKRSSMINEDEKGEIVSYAYQYIFALNEQIALSLDFQLNHNLYNAFKEKVTTFSSVVLNDDWKDLIQNDDSLDGVISELKEKIGDVEGELSKAKQMKAQLL